MLLNRMFWATSDLSPVQPKHGMSDDQADVQVVTAFVMVSQQMDAELALKYVQMKHPPAWPNQGFRYQLKLFEDMGCKLVCNAPPPFPPPSTPHMRRRLLIVDTTVATLGLRA